MPLQVLSMGVGYACFLVAALITLSVIPSDIRPRHGWPLAYEWVSFTFVGLLALWLTVTGHTALTPPRPPSHSHPFTNHTPPLFTSPHSMHVCTSVAFSGPPVLQ